MENKDRGDFLSLLKKHDTEKMALITDDRIYTYGQLISEAEKLRDRDCLSDFSLAQRRVVFIYKDFIAEQLIYFLAYSGTNLIPVIATKASQQQNFAQNDIKIPQRAVMGVMTSGSTGKSKLLWRNYASWANFFPEQNRIFKINTDSVIFCQGSLAFTGNLNIYIGTFAAGATIVCTEKFQPAHWLDMIEQYEVNAMYLIPTKLLLLTKFAAKKDMSNKIVQSIISGSQSLGKCEVAKIKQIFPDSEITLYYGASELNYISYIKGQDMTEDKTVVGKPFVGVKVDVINEEIFVDTPYGIESIQMPFSLKDKGCIDENGNLHFLGRKDDIVNVNGIKVSSYKVENAIAKACNNAESSVFVVHMNNADTLTACIVYNVHDEETHDRVQLLKALREYLEAYEIPKKFIFVEELPKNESGKIDKLKLKNIYACI